MQAVPRRGVSIHQFLKKRLPNYKYKDVLRSVGQRYESAPFVWTWSDLLFWSDAWGRGLHGLGVREGQPMVTILGSTAESVVTDIGAARVNGVVVPVAPEDSDDDRAAALHASRARVLMASHEHNGQAVPKELREMIPELRNHDLGEYVKSFGFKHLRLCVTTSMDHNQGFVRMCDLTAKNPADDILDLVDADPSAPVLALPADGSEAAGLLTFDQAGIVEAAEHTASAFGLEESDRLCVASCLSDPVGKVVGLYAPLANGSYIILPGCYFAPSKVHAAVTEQFANGLVLSAGQLQELLDAQLDWSSNKIEKLIVAGESVPSAALLDSAKRTLGARVVKVAVGSRRTSGPALLSGSGDPLSLAPLPGVQVQTKEDGHLHALGVVTPLEGRENNQWYSLGFRGTVSNDSVSLSQE
mmetsp:Transcript_30643/g.85828  ORF Transcript_30643/g.85828 Transcript_30643/m.85828 type:complete len:414 (+) Transcript_30643:49-1290(+)